MLDDPDIDVQFTPSTADSNNDDEDMSDAAIALAEAGGCLTCSDCAEPASAEDPLRSCRACDHMVHRDCMFVSEKIKSLSDRAVNWREHVFCSPECARKIFPVSLFLLLLYHHDLVLFFDIFLFRRPGNDPYLVSIL